ncbi:Hypothetical_protein [Hexamita inflata]|uniref:Hypothetical_protein n=1 Tax=Hexamita inflata TaxID=28002 RepID=A0ABP1HZC3_9EUKA
MNSKVEILHGRPKALLAPRVGRRCFGRGPLRCSRPLVSPLNAGWKCCRALQMLRVFVSQHFVMIKCNEWQFEFSCQVCFWTRTASASTASLTNSPFSEKDDSKFLSKQLRNQDKLGQLSENIETRLSRGFTFHQRM